MIELLTHLWPNFGDLVEGTTNGLSAAFWLIMISIITIAIVSLIKHARHFKERVLAVRGLIAGQNKEELALNRRETLQRALSLKAPGVGLLWREFDESLVVSGDNRQLFNTLDAEHFFNPRTLAPGLTASRLLAATPSFLVAIGVLGTFVGLTIGLEGLNVNSTNVDVLKSGINQLIGGAAVAFMTSVWGVALSLLLNLIEKMYERNALSEIRLLQQEIDYLYPRIPAEQSLVLIAEHSKESKEALQELHERIGDRLQETINGMSESMQQAITDALNNVMAPAMQTLVNSASQQSTNALEKLVGQFMDGMTSVGREQGSHMQDAAAQVNAAVSSMGGQIDQLFRTISEQQNRQLESTQNQADQFESQLERMQSTADQRQERLEQRFSELIGSLGAQLEAQSASSEQREIARQQRFGEQIESVTAQQKSLLDNVASAVLATQEQSRQMAEGHQQLMARLQLVSEAAATSSRHMDSSATQLGLLSTHVRQAAELLGQRLDAVAARVESAGSLNVALADRLQSQAQMLAQLQVSLLEGAQRFEQAAGEVRNGFGEMRKHQQEFLNGVHSEFMTLGEALREQVEMVEKQAEQWLQKYANQVNTQVHERMDAWNRETLGFSTQMHAAVQAISNVVDELGSR